MKEGTTKKVILNITAIEKYMPIFDYDDDIEDLDEALGFCIGVGFCRIKNEKIYPDGMCNDYKCRYCGQVKRGSELCKRR